MKLAVVGVGGVRTPLLLRGILRRQEMLDLAELYLMDIDAQYLELMMLVAEPLLREVGLHTVWTTDAEEAIRGADYILTTFRVGGIRSRVIDEKVPLKYHVLGQETTGPGGFAMALRTIPVIFKYVDLIKKLAPRAWLVNFTNPSGIITEAVVNHAGFERIVGICDNPSSMQRVVAAYLGVAADDLFLEYFGLNHLGWVRAVYLDGKDILPEIIQGLKASGERLEGLPFDPSFIETLGMIPNEYLHFYYHTDQAVENIIKAGKSRGEQIQELNDWFFEELGKLKGGAADDKLSPRRRGKASCAQGRGDSLSEEGIRQLYNAYLQRRGETYMTIETGAAPHAEELVEMGIEEEGYEGVALGVVECLSGARRGVAILNVPNRGAIEGMGEKDVVEVTCYLYRSLIRPMAMGPIPDSALGLMKQVKEYERLTIEAAISGSYRLALKALALHPLVPTYEVAKRILDDYIEAHGDLFPELK